MTVLALRLAGPMQAWGASSRFTIRDTRREPSKSGVMGLLAAALGRHRGAELGDLAALRFGVRVDQPGQVMRDFQTARDAKGATVSISQRYYLADAIFLAAIEGTGDFISSLDHAVRNPVFPLYLGRRGCPASQPLSLGLRDGDVAHVLASEPWLAATWFQKETHRRTSGRDVVLDVLRDAAPDEVGEPVRDVPLNFDPVYRRYAWRDVYRERVVIPNPSVPVNAPNSESEEPDWIAEAGGSDVPL